MSRRHSSNAMLKDIEDQRIKLFDNILSQLDIKNNHKQVLKQRLGKPRDSDDKSKKKEESYKDLDK